MKTNKQIFAEIRASKTTLTNTNTIIKGDDRITYEIYRNAKGSFYTLINGKRITRTNYARNYDAVGTINNAIDKLGMKRIKEITA